MKKISRSYFVASRELFKEYWEIEDVLKNTDIYNNPNPTIYVGVTEEDECGMCESTEVELKGECKSSIIKLLENRKEEIEKTFNEIMGELLENET